MSKYKILGAIALQAASGCAHVYGASEKAFTEDAFDKLSTDCDMGIIANDAKRRLPAENQTSSDGIGTRLVAQEKSRELIMYYEPYPLADDPDRIVVRAGGAYAIYNKRTCEFIRMKYYR